MTTQRLGRPPEPRVRRGIERLPGMRSGTVKRNVLVGLAYLLVLSVLVGLAQQLLGIT